MTNDEAFHALIIFAEEYDPGSDYADRVKWLKLRGYLSGGFDQNANGAVERGTVAQILAQILDIKGGLTMRLVGPHPRYATQELVFLGIMPPSSSQQGLPGIDFVGINAMAEKYLEERT